MWYAELETHSFHFEGFGDTEYAARRALHTALVAHAKQYGLDLLSRGWYFPDDCRVREIVIGQGYRDRLKGKDHANLPSPRSSARRRWLHLLEYAEHTKAHTCRSAI